ncbi:rubrerythrin family protein [Haloglomus litoreum]|uniref:rubrerythrin family protein n=1 Tax=Haloglomus litoreum TaxID=3034026 RepID=UPI003B210812
MPAVREANKTELSRLGSSKALYALTAGEMEPDAVLTAMADDHAAAAETYEGWAAADDAADLFGAAAEAEQDAYDTVAGELDAHEPGEAPDLYAAMGSAETGIERLGAFVGRTLVAKAHRSQATGFFTGQADPGTASTFRGLGSDLEDHLADAVDALDALADDDDDWELAEAAANEVIGAAYEDYFSTLEGMGVNPKPVC